MGEQVSLQIVSKSKLLVALCTIVFFVSTVSCDIVALCALVLLLPCVGELVSLQRASFTKQFAALSTIVLLFSTVGDDVVSKMTSSNGGIVALCAPVLLLSSVDEQVIIQS